MAVIRCFRSSMCVMDSPALRMSACWHGTTGQTSGQRARHDENITASAAIYLLIYYENCTRSTEENIKKVETNAIYGSPLHAQHSTRHIR